MNVELISEYQGHEAPIYKLGRVEDLLYSASSDRMLGAWGLSTNKPAPFSVKAEAGIYTFYHNGRVLYLGCSSGHMHVIDTQEKVELKNLKLHKKGVYSVLEIPEHNLLVTGGGDGFVQFLKLDNYSLVRGFKLSDFKIRCLVKSKDGEKVLVSGGDGEVREIELTYFNEVNRFSASEKSVNVVGYHPTKPLVYTAGADGFVKFWKDGKNILELPIHNMSVYGLSFNSTGEIAVSVSRDKSIKIWSAADFQLLEKIERRNLKGHSHSVNTFCWVGENEFCTAGDDRIIKRWKVKL